MSSTLFTTITLHGVTLRNRVVVPPMCQYSATDGMPGDWHFVHMVGRGHLKNHQWTIHAAKELGAEAAVPPQYLRAYH